MVSAVRPRCRTSRPGQRHRRGPGRRGEDPPGGHRGVGAGQLGQQRGGRHQERDPRRLHGDEVAVRDGPAHQAQCAAEVGPVVVLGRRQQVPRTGQLVGPQPDGEQRGRGDDQPGRRQPEDPPGAEPGPERAAPPAAAPVTRSRRWPGARPPAGSASGRSAAGRAPPGSAVRGARAGGHPGHGSGFSGRLRGGHADGNGATAGCARPGGMPLRRGVICGRSASILLGALGR